MKKILSFLTAFISLCSVVSCEGKKPAAESKSESSKAEYSDSATISENTGETAEIDENFRQTIYGEKKIALPKDCWDFQNMKYIAEKDSFYVLYNDMDFNLKLCVYSSDFANYSEKIVIENGGGLRYISDIDETGKITILISERKSSGVSDNAEDHFKHSGYFYTLKEFDENQQEIYSNEIADMDYYYNTKGTEPISIEKFKDESFLVTTNNGLMIMEKSGEITEIPNTSMIVHAGVYAEGKIAVAEYQTVNFIDENYRFSEDISLNNAVADGNVFAGDGEFLLYISCVDGIYGVTENHEVELVVDYSASYLPVGDIYTVEKGGNDFFIYGTNKGLPFISRIFPRSDDYSLDREKITLACTYNNEDYMVLANDFNKRSDKYFLEIRESAEFDDIKMEILTGNAPDIIKYNDVTIMENLVNLGGITDMYQLMEQYDGVEKADILQNVVEALEYRDSLYGISPTFFINCIIADKNFIGEEYTDWSFDEFFTLYESRPAGMKLSYDYYTRSPENVFGRFCAGGYFDNLAAWIDGDKCRFNSEEFIRFLEFCRNAETASSDASAAEVAASLKNRTAMIGFAEGMNYIRDFQMLNTYQLGIDGLSYLSFPDTNSGGTVGFQDFYSITENSDCKEGAWEFISYIMSEEYQSSENDSGRLFTLKNAFEKSLAENTLAEGQENPVGELGFDGYIVPYNLYITEDEAELIRNVVSRCTAKIFSSEQISSICNEEFLLYINGEYTAEECAEIIQNRVSIMLSEQS